MRLYISATSSRHGYININIENFGNLDTIVGAAEVMEITVNDFLEYVPFYKQNDVIRKLISKLRYNAILNINHTECGYFMSEYLNGRLDLETLNNKIIANKQSLVSSMLVKNLLMNAGLHIDRCLYDNGIYTITAKRVKNER